MRIKKEMTGKKEMRKKPTWSVLCGLLFLTLAGLSPQVTQAQILKPVKWQYAAKKINEKEALILVRALIDEGWHIYSLNVPEGGPEKTEIRLTPSKAYTAVGAAQEPQPKRKYEEVFDMDVPYFDGAVVFQQKIQLHQPQTTVRGTIRFMVCDESRCLPAEDIDFAIKIE